MFGDTNLYLTTFLNILSSKHCFEKKKLNILEFVISLKRLKFENFELYSIVLTRSCYPSVSSAFNNKGKLKHVKYY